MELNNRDKQIIFNEKYHTYTVNGKRLKSVSKFITSLFEKFDEDKCIQKIFNSEKRNDPAYEYYKMDKQEILDLWTKQKNLGIFLHKQIENYYKFGSIPEEKSIEFNYFINFKNRNFNLTFFKSEWMIFSEKNGIAGTVDMIYQNQEGKYCICDFKRCKSINKNENYQKYSIHQKLNYIVDNKYNHYSFQLNLYKYILENEYNMKIDFMFLLVLHPNNNNFITIEIENLEKEMKILFES